MAHPTALAYLSYILLRRKVIFKRLTEPKVCPGNPCCILSLSQATMSGQDLVHDSRAAWPPVTRRRCR